VGGTGIEPVTPAVAHLAPWRQGQPGGEVFGSWPSAEIGAAFGDQTHSQVGPDSMDLGQIDASELVHEATHVEAQRVGLLGPVACLRQWLLRYGLAGGKHGQRAFDLGVTFVDPGLVEVIQC
jgi:hypothetical protein